MGVFLEFEFSPKFYLFSCCVHYRVILYRDTSGVNSITQSAGRWVPEAPGFESWCHHRRATWWRYQMESFSVLLARCAGNSPVTGEFVAQRLATRSFDVFFDLCLNKRLSKQPRGWWFETQSGPLRRHCNDLRSLSCASTQSKLNN